MSNLALKIVLKISKFEIVSILYVSKQPLKPNLSLINYILYNDLQVCRGILFFQTPQIDKQFPECNIQNMQNMIGNLNNSILCIVDNGENTNKRRRMDKFRFISD